MIIRPLYSTLLLPEVSYFFKKDFFSGWTDEPIEPNTEILFLFLKDDKEDQDFSAADFYPIGVSAKVEAVREDENIQVRTLERVDISDLEITDCTISASASIRPENVDISEAEEQEAFSRLRSTLLKFVQNYQWGLWARGFLLQRKNLNDTACALSDYLNLTADEKYAIIAADSRRERDELIIKAVNELIEFIKVSDEAQTAQKDDQNQLYREAALKKQIDYLQRELDDMHPENISDVRKFEKKIARSGMNKDARREAEKVLNRMRQEGNESHEYGMLYDYLDFVTSLSWKTPKAASIDLKKAEEILDEDHYGLKKVKERIIQQLAVMALNKKQSGSILLFVGAPGTGKTSIGQSIARALDVPVRELIEF